MGLFSRKPKYEEQLKSAKQIAPNDFLVNRIVDLQDRLSALEEHLGIYPVSQPKKYVYKKRGELGLGGVTQDLTASRNSENGLV